MTKARILIVEDEDVLARTLQDLLESVGYTVTALVAYGEEVIQKATETHTDLVLMDIVLEGDMDGIEAAQQIREHLNIPVVYLTAYADDTTLDRAKVTEPSGYVLKPFDRGELCAAIEVGLYRHQVEKERRRAEEALREMEEKAREQERLAAVGQLAAGVAHDFNNLLTGIMGYAELLGMRSDLPASVKRELEHILGAGQRGVHLIQQVLDFSRQSLVHSRPLDLVSFLEEIVVFLQRTIPENVRVITDTEIGDYVVHADPAQLQQVLTNLAVNARDAMTDGGELQLQLSRFTLEDGEYPPVPEMPAGEWVVLSVSDTGTGIPPEDLGHIYEPFFTTKEVGSGTGLGLAQVYGIVMQHEGFIDVESELGKGTTFIVYLPVLSIPEEASDADEREELPRGQGEMVLLVEDSPEVLHPIRAMLERLEYRVLTATDGQEALGVYEKHRDEIDLVLTDMVMPGMRGAKLFHTLREQDPEVKVVVMSGYPLQKEKTDLLSQGISAWVQKPMKLKTLSRRIREAFV